MLPAVLGAGLATTVSPASSSATGAPTASSGVVDLCRLPAPQKGGVGWAKQRLVLFELGGEDVTAQPEKETNEQGDVPGVEHRVFQAASIHNHLRNVFFSAFPMERFDTVVAQLTADPGLFAKPTISQEEMVRAAELDPFAAYSIACSDWVMAPRIVGKTATWRKVMKERQVGKQTVKYQAWDLSTQFELEVAVYRFDGAAWIHADTVKDSGSMMDLSVALAESGHALNQLISGMKPKEQRPLVSAQPEPQCRVPLVDDLKDIADGFGKCGEATIAATSSATSALQLNDEPAHDDAPDASAANKGGSGGSGSGGPTTASGGSGGTSGKP